jgi:hypothetical protein
VLGTLTKKNPYWTKARAAKFASRGKFGVLLGGPQALSEYEGNQTAMVTLGAAAVGSLLVIVVNCIHGSKCTRIRCCGFECERAVNPASGESRSWPFFTLSSLVFVLSEIVLGGCCYFQWILCFGQSFPQDVGTEGSF